MNHKNISKEDWARIIYGLRKKLNLSQTRLSKKLDLCRQSLGRFEKKQRIPDNQSKNIILKFILKNNLKTDELKQFGKHCYLLAQKREKLAPLKLEKSEELAELIGIILGDGEIKKDGSIRISFDPRKDRDFLYRRVFYLIKNILRIKITFESYKRICFWNISFVKYLKINCNLKPGSKFENNWGIPKWCFSKKEYLSAVLRGLFDTDGYFGYCQSSVEVMYGRFSDKCINLVADIENAMKYLGLNPVTKHTKDGRFKIRLSNKKEAITFFSLVGTSNLKHIVRFLLWRMAGYEARIEKEGLSALIRKCNMLISKEAAKIMLPYYWKNNITSKHPNFIPQDKIFIRTHIKKTKVI